MEKYIQMLIIEKVDHQRDFEYCDVTGLAQIEINMQQHVNIVIFHLLVCNQ